MVKIYVVQKSRKGTRVFASRLTKNAEVIGAKNIKEAFKKAGLNYGDYKTAKYGWYIKKRKMKNGRRNRRKLPRRSNAAQTRSDIGEGSRGRGHG